MNIRTLMSIALLTLAPIKSAFSQSSPNVRTITSDEWTAVLTTADNSSPGVNRDLSTLIHDAAVALGKVATDGAKKSSSTQTAQTMLFSTLLTWYSTELRTTFISDEDRRQWQAERLATANMCKVLRKNFGSVVNDSWKTLMSACRVLGYPQASLPE